MSNIIDLLQKQLKNRQMTTCNLCKGKPKVGKEINTLLLSNGSQKGENLKDRRLCVYVCVCIYMGLAYRCLFAALLVVLSIHPSKYITYHLSLICVG